MYGLWPSMQRQTHTVVFGHPKRRNRRSRDVPPSPNRRSDVYRPCVQLTFAALTPDPVIHSLPWQRISHWSDDVSQPTSVTSLLSWRRLTQPLAGATSLPQPTAGPHTRTTWTKSFTKESGHHQFRRSENYFVANLTAYVHKWSNGPCYCTMFYCLNTYRVAQERKPLSSIIIESY